MRRHDKSKNKDTDTDTDTDTDKDTDTDTDKEYIEAIKEEYKEERHQIESMRRHCITNQKTKKNGKTFW
jgi:hypothetical protein